MTKKSRQSQAAAAEAARREASDAARRAIARERYAAHVNNRVISMLRRLEADVVKRLSAFDPEDASARVSRLKKLKREIGEEIEDRYRQMAEAADGDLRKLAAAEARWKHASLERAWASVGVSADPALASKSFLDALVSQPIVLGDVAREYWKEEGQALARRFQRQMQLGVSGGEGIGDLIRRVRGSKASGFRDGIMAVTRRNAESLVRTSVNSVANAAHLATYDANDDVVEALQHYSILDQRTTLICSGRHGLMWMLDRTPIGHSTPFETPPLHWRCRSILSAVLDVTADHGLPTFDEWFAGLKAEQQNKLFGPGRANLWREGRITQASLLDQSGRPLTLAELVD